MELFAILLSSLIAPAILLLMNKKIKETHRQVTVNHHSSEHPTLLDLIDMLRKDNAEDNSETRKLINDHIHWHMKKD